MPGRVTLVRHTEVARRWRGRCYGASDVGLSRAGAAAIGPLAAELVALRPEWVVHSDLARTRRLASAIAQAAQCPLIAAPAWRERDFGAWEGQTWTAIYRASGAAMDGMIDAPDTFRPGGGETTFELAARASAAWSALPQGSGLVVAHGGPIAALLGQRQGLAPRAWLALVPPLGASVELAPGGAA
ncbi:MAG: histidine phosphatase family protein [Erythrobacter sp.]